MEKFGVVGRSLVHSYSPLLHKKFGDYSYELLTTEPEDVEALLRSGEYRGFNITIPYKQMAMEYCDEISSAAHRIGCINTVIRDDDGRLRGYNTDYFGCRYLLKANGIDAAGRKCLILGSGATSHTARAALEDLGASKIVTISRSGEDNYDNLFRHADAEIIVNTTPVGMYPNNLATLLDLEQFPQLRGVADIIYNPYRTRLVLDADRMGIPCTGGLDMLVAQGWEASRLFGMTDLEESDIPDVVSEIRDETLNTILIGMPGAGKTMLGHMIAKRKGHIFLDTDHMVEGHEGMTIPEIFEKKGEEYFRRVETQMLAEACKENGRVIATGGGIVTRPENRYIMRQNGIVIWIKRDLDKLDTRGRPLSQMHKVEKLYRERKDIYDSWSDYFIDNNQELK